MIHVLLVEDNLLVREMITERLRWEGMQVTSVTTGEEVMPLATSMQPAVILMDMGLPGIDGWKVTRQLKANPLTRRIAVIALTAYTSKQHIEMSFQAGCDDFEAKPIYFPRLLHKIQRLAEK